MISNKKFFGDQKFFKEKYEVEPTYVHQLIEIDLEMDV